MEGQEGRSSETSESSEDDASEAEEGNNIERPMLDVAAFYGKVEDLEAELRKGVEVDVRATLDQCTALHRACENNQPAAAALLLRQGADPDAVNIHQNTPLHYACVYGTIECARLILEAGGDKDARGAYDKTPRKEAEARGHPEIVELLDSVTTSKEARRQEWMAKFAGPSSLTVTTPSP